MHRTHAKAGQLGLDNENTQEPQPELRPKSQPSTGLAKTLDATPRAGTFIMAAVPGALISLAPDTGCERHCCLCQKGFPRSPSYITSSLFIVRLGGSDGSPTSFAQA